MVDRRFNEMMDDAVRIAEEEGRLPKEPDSDEEDGDEESAKAIKKTRRRFIEAEAPSIAEMIKEEDRQAVEGEPIYTCFVEKKSYMKKGRFDHLFSFTSGVELKGMLDQFLGLH